MDQSRILLNDGRHIPQLGLGTWQTEPDATAVAVRHALGAGYRSIDTAAIYRNEEGVGEAVRSGDVPREQVFVTTKLWNTDQGYDAARRAFDSSLERLGLDYVDLYLIHWPAPKQDRYVDSWRALIALRDEGRARSVGVSNFGAEHLKRIVDATGVIPVLNQVELHPSFQQNALRAVHAEYEIATESWSPLGQAKALDDPTLLELARKHGRSAAQVVIRWHLQEGLVVIPKSADPARMDENLAVFDFQLDPEDMERLRGMDRSDGRLGPDPDTADF